MATTVESVVREQYAEGAREVVDALCCPVEYDADLLAVIPEEVVERDYGCGDPSRWLNEGERVLDLGSGTGKICFIASQIVGPAGSVIGVDMTPEMLDIARRNAPLVAERIGYGNVRFVRGHIQDLALDLDDLDRELASTPITSSEELFAARARADHMRLASPMIEDESIDVVVSNCVLNLVDGADKPEMFREIHRVLAPGGRAVISDIVSDEPVPDHLQADPDLWSGCVSGAMTEEAFLAAFEQAGFYGMTLRVRQRDPWRTVEGIEFRSVTLEAFKGKEGACWERNQAVVYRGPFREVLDDDGHRLRRGERVAVCEKTFRLYGAAPYVEYFEFIDPIEDVPLAEARPFDCSRTVKRHPRESKGLEYEVTTEPSGEVCGPDGCC